MLTLQQLTNLTATASEVTIDAGHYDYQDLLSFLKYYHEDAAKLNLRNCRVFTSEELTVLAMAGKSSGAKVHFDLS